jgi:hypothetical protein
MLSQHRVAAVLIEYNGIRMAQMGKTYTDFMQAFARHGYYPVELRLDRIARIESGELDPATVCVDFLFASSKRSRVAADDSGNCISLSRKQDPRPAQ